MKLVSQILIYRFNPRKVRLDLWFYKQLSSKLRIIALIYFSNPVGRALVWPSVLNEDPNKSDSRMYHEARPVIKGIKYAANHWIHQYDSKNENLWGCSGSFS